MITLLYNPLFFAMGAMRHRRHKMSPKPLQLKIVRIQHDIFWKVVDFLHLKMICSIKVMPKNN